MTDLTLALAVTVLFAPAAACATWRAFERDDRASRTDDVLIVAMAATMIAMAWLPFAQAVTTALAGVFAASTVWFALRARSAGTRWRMSHHAFMAAAMTLMLLAMLPCGDRVTTQPHPAHTHHGHDVAGPSDPLDLLLLGCGIVLIVVAVLWAAHAGSGVRRGDPRAAGASMQELAMAAGMAAMAFAH